MIQTQSHNSCIEWARSIGSSATTHRGAYRYLRSARRPVHLSGTVTGLATWEATRERSRLEGQYRDEVRSRAARNWGLPASQRPTLSCREWWHRRNSRTRLEVRADVMAHALGITWTQRDAWDEAHRLTQADRTRCHEAAKRRDATLTRRAMGRRTVRVIHRSTEAGRPLVLWFRRGESSRRLTGWDDGHIWTVQVPLRLDDAQAALSWLQPESVDVDTLRQGEWYFVPLSPAEDRLCEEAWEQGFALDDEHTDAGSEHHLRYTRGRWSSRHHAEAVVVMSKQGCTAFIGRSGRTKYHDYEAHPRLYVRGTITAQDHPDLVLPPGWYEVIGNRAVGEPAAMAQDLD